MKIVSKNIENLISKNVIFRYRARGPSLASAHSRRVPGRARGDREARILPEIMIIENSKNREKQDASLAR